MNGIDWTAAGVVVSIGGALLALLLVHTRTLARIESVVRGLADRMAENREDHRDLWNHINRHGETLTEHGLRLTKLEREPHGSGVD